jgi:hypothetical protein
MPYVDEFNTFEAGLWTVFAVVTVCVGHRVRGLSRPVQGVLVLLFLAFGVLDVAEISTGAWWRPWWLLVWKGACLAGFFGCAMAVRRNRQAIAEAQASAAEPSASK